MIKFVEKENSDLYLLNNTYVVLISIPDITHLIKQVNFVSNKRTVIRFHW